MENNLVSLTTYLVFLFGSIAVFFVYIFGNKIYNKNYSLDILRHLRSLLKHKIMTQKIPDDLVNVCSEYLERRNEFWINFGQTIVVIFIIVVLTVLLLTKTITSEAGLPILSAVSGFAISKVISKNNRRNTLKTFDNKEN